MDYYHFTARLDDLDDDDPDSKFGKAWIDAIRKCSSLNERICAYNRWYADFINSNQANELFSKDFEEVWIYLPDPLSKWPLTTVQTFQGYFRDDFNAYIAGGEPYAHFPARDWIPSCPVEG